MKKQIILALAFLIVGVLPAQEKGSYLDFNVGGGLHTLSYTLLNGTQKGQPGYTLNAGYSYFFTPNWGIRTGLGFQTFSSVSTINFLSATPDVDSQGQAYVFNANYINSQEKQQVMLLDVPVAVQYRRSITNKIGLLVSLGGKIAFPFQSTFKTTGGEIVTTGYYSVWNVELSDMPQHGFSTMTNSFTGNTTLKTSYLGIADLGGLIKLSRSLDLYVGGYLNYGLNNVLTADTRLIYQPNGAAGTPGTYNGLFASTQTRSVTPVSFGVKVGVYLHLEKNRHTGDTGMPPASVDSTGRNKSGQAYSLNLADSLNFVTFLNSKGVFVKRDKTKLTPEELKEYNESIVSKSPDSKGNSNSGQSINTSIPGGMIIPLPPTGAFGTTGKDNRGQVADSSNVANSFNGKGIDRNGNITKMTPEELKEYNKSLLSKSSDSKGSSTSGQSIHASIPGGMIIPVPPTGASGTNRKFNPGQDTDSSGVANSFNGKDAGRDVTKMTPKELKKYNKSLLSKSSDSKGSSNSGQPIHASIPGGMIIPLPSTGAIGISGKYNRGQASDSSGVANSNNGKGIDRNGNITRMTPEELKEYNKSLLSKSSDSKGNSNSGQSIHASVSGGMIIPGTPTGVYGTTGKYNRGQASDSTGIANASNPNGVRGNATVIKPAPKGIRKFIMSILSRPSNQKGKSGQGQPTDGLNPAGNINSFLPTGTSNPTGNLNPSTDAFVRAKQLSSTMSQWFEFDSYEITNANDAKTKELSDILRANPNFLLVFVGYTCNIGTQVVNIKLGMKRVESVIQKFKEQGVSESQLIGESKGYDEPLVPNTSAENRAKNRRVEITVIKDY